MYNWCSCKLNMPMITTRWVTWAVPPQFIGVSAAYDNYMTSDATCLLLWLCNNKDNIIAIIIALIIVMHCISIT